VSSQVTVQAQANVGVTVDLKKTVTQPSPTVVVLVSASADVTVVQRLIVVESGGGGPPTLPVPETATEQDIVPLDQAPPQPMQNGSPPADKPPERDDAPLPPPPNKEPQVPQRALLQAQAREAIFVNLERQAESPGETSSMSTLAADLSSGGLSFDDAIAAAAAVAYYLSPGAAMGGVDSRTLRKMLSC
jgi:hypothetical protein